MWLSFAANGDPNPTDRSLPYWPKYDEDGRNDPGTVVEFAGTGNFSVHKDDSRYDALTFITSLNGYPLGR
jgi:hypothetical protein